MRDAFIEPRKGSNDPVKQHVWGTRYIDELVQIGLNDWADSPGPQVMDRFYWVCQDSNYNVLGIVDEDAVLAERYEYTPYGQRTVLFSPGSNDVGCFAPTQASRRMDSIDFGLQPFGICDVGHQGLIHDEELGLIYNRARMLHPGLGRFMQRDPLGYVDGAALYEYIQSQPGALQDPSGLACRICFKCVLVGQSSGSLTKTCKYSCLEDQSQPRIDVMGGNINCDDPRLQGPQVMTDSKTVGFWCPCPTGYDTCRHISDWEDPFSNCSVSACLAAADAIRDGAIDACNLIPNPQLRAACIAAATAAHDAHRAACALCELP